MGVHFCSVGVTAISGEVKEFIAKYIDSVESLEVLLLLLSRPEKSWSPEEITQQIRSSRASIDGRLAHLKRHGFLKRDDSPSQYRYQPASTELDEQLRKLAEAYKEFRVGIVELIYRPEGGIRSFADAFKLKKEDDNG